MTGKKAWIIWAGTTMSLINTGQTNAGRTAATEPSRPTLRPSMDIWTVTEEEKARTKYTWLVICGVLGIALLMSELYYRCKRIMGRG